MSSKDGLLLESVYAEVQPEVNALSPGGHGLVLLFCCGPSPAVHGVQNLFLDDMRVRMVAEAFG